MSVDNLNLIPAKSHIYEAYAQLKASKRAKFEEGLTAYLESERNLNLNQISPEASLVQKQVLESVHPKPVLFSQPLGPKTTSSQNKTDLSSKSEEEGKPKPPKLT